MHLFTRMIAMFIGNTCNTLANIAVDSHPFCYIDALLVQMLLPSPQLKFNPTCIISLPLQYSLSTSTIITFKRLFQ